MIYGGIGYNFSTTQNKLEIIHFCVRRREREGMGAEEIFQKSFNAFFFMGSTQIYEKTKQNMRKTNNFLSSFAWFHEF